MQSFPMDLINFVFAGHYYYNISRPIVRSKIPDNFSGT